MDFVVGVNAIVCQRFADEIRFSPPKDCELLIDDLLVYEPAR